MDPKTSLSKFLSKYNTQIAILLILSLVVSGAIFITQIGDTNKEVPEDKPFAYEMIYSYETVEFEYGYTGEGSEVDPKRVVLHTGEEITRESILHDFRPKQPRNEQSYTVNLKEIAEDPSDHLRTHKRINMTVVYENGSRETITSTTKPENVSELLRANYQVESGSSPSTATVYLNSFIGENVTIDAPNKTYTLSREDEISIATIKPSDYYVDTDGDNVYEKPREIPIKVNYNDVSRTVGTIRLSHPEPQVQYAEQNDGDHNTLQISDMERYESVSIYTPNGKYILKNYYNQEDEQYVGGDGEYVQRVDEVGSTIYPTLSIDEEAERVEIQTSINGSQYVIYEIYEESTE